MASVCAVVQNSVSRDARVLKQASTLAKAGHAVTIVGLQDAYNREPETLLDNGVRIVRVAPPSAPKKAFAISKYLFHFLSIIRKFSVISAATLILILLIASRNQTWLDRDQVLYISAIGLASIIILKELSVLSGQLFTRGRAIFTGIAGTIAPGLVESFGRAKLRNRAMTDAVLKLCPDIVHCHDIHTLPVGASVKRRLGCPVIYDAHEIYEDLAQGNKAATKRYRYLHRKHVGLPDHFITINESIADWYAQSYPSLPLAIIIKNASEMASPFNYDGRMHAAAELPKGAKIVLYQGGYATKRGLEYLVRAAEFLPDDWTLVMMGWGSLEDHLRSIAEDIAKHANRKPRVRFIPPAPHAELALWTAGATIGVIPYERVGLNHLYCTPNKLWEYPNAGVPVLVSPFPELKKAVEGYGYGWLLPESEDPKALAEQIALLTDVEITRARKACRAFMAEDNWSKYAARLVELYSGAVAAPTESDVERPGSRQVKITATA